MNLKKLERYLRVNLLGPGPRLMKKFTGPRAVSQRLRNTALVDNTRQSQEKDIRALSEMVTHNPSKRAAVYPRRRTR